MDWPTAVEYGKWEGLIQIVPHSVVITPLKIENLVHVQREPRFYGDVSLRNGKQYSLGYDPRLTFS